MIRFNTPILGEVAVGFRHELPRVEVKQVNRLVDAKLIKYQGKTTCFLEYVDPRNGQETRIVGYSHCNPEDAYCREEGRHWSLKRALEVTGFTPKVKRQILAGYNSR